MTDNQNAVIADGARQLPVRAGLPGRLAAGLPALLAPGSGRRRRLHLLDHRASRRATTRRRSRSTRAGTRTTAPTALRNGANISFTVPQACAEIFFTYDSDHPRADRGRQRSPEGATSAAPRPTGSPRTPSPGTRAPCRRAGTSPLHYDADGGLALDPDGVTGGTSIPLTWDPAGLSAAVRDEVPAPRRLPAFHIPASRLAEVPAALKGQIAVDAKDGGGTLVDATGLQIQGVLDDLYTYDGAAGRHLRGRQCRRCGSGRPPPARSSSTCSTTPTRPPTLDRRRHDRRSGDRRLERHRRRRAGTASTTSTRWRSTSAPTGKVETNLVTDPVLGEPVAQQPAQPDRRPRTIAALEAGRAGTALRQAARSTPPRTSSSTSCTSATSAPTTPACPPSSSGTFKAFTLPTRTACSTCARLALAGLTHVHLLPAFDIATINEDKSQWQQPAGRPVELPARLRAAAGAR